MRRSTFRLCRGAGDLRSGEIVKTIDIVGLFQIAELRPGQLVGHRPRRQHRCAAKVAVELGDSGQVQANDAGIGQVVFRREAVWRIDEQAQREMRRPKKAPGPATTVRGGKTW